MKIWQIGIAVLIAATAAMASLINGYLDIVHGAVPSPPPIGQARLYLNRSTLQLGCMLPDGSSCAIAGVAGSTAHLYRDQVPVLQGDGSYLVSNPLAGSSPDPNSIEVVANGLVLTGATTATLPIADYSLDPQNPLHIVPNSQLDWSGFEVRVSFVVYL